MTLTGSVTKWFNRKGFGFINVLDSDSELVGQDVFVHLTGINVSNDGYKSLFPGEYVSFDLDTNNDRPVCVNVTGVMGGPLLVEHPDYRFKYSLKNPRDRTTNNDNSTQTNNDVQDTTEVDNTVEVEQ